MFQADSNTNSRDYGLRPIPNKKKLIPSSHTRQPHQITQKIQEI